MYLAIYEKDLLNPIPQGGTISSSYFLAVQYLDWKDFVLDNGATPGVGYAFVNDVTVPISPNTDDCGSQFSTFQITLGFMLVKQLTATTYQAYDEVLSSACFRHLFVVNEPCGEENGEGEIHYEITTEEYTFTACCPEDPNNFNIGQDQFQEVAHPHQKVLVKNPFSEKLQFSAWLEEGTLEINLFDLKGQSFWKNNSWSESGPQRFFIDTASLPSGIYYLSIRQNDNLNTLKLVKL